MVKETFQKAVKARINGDKQHGWGVDDSLAVIVALLEDETGQANYPAANPDLIAAFKEVINPSQFRQKMETAGFLAKSEGKAAKVNALLADFKP